MNKAFLYNICICFFTAYSFLSGAPAPIQTRYVIDQADHKQERMWLIEAQPGIVVINPSDRSSTRSKEFTQLRVTFRNGVVRINGKLVSSNKVLIYPAAGLISINGVAQMGSLMLELDKKQIHLTQYLDIDQAHTQFVASCEWWKQPIADTSPKVVTQKISSTHKKSSDSELATSVAVNDMASEVQQADEEDRKARIVRVLLDEKKGSGTHWTLSCKHAMVLADMRTESPVASDMNLMKIGLKNGWIQINGKKYTQNQLIIVPRAGRIKCLDGEYEGSMLIVKQGDTLMLINGVDLEDYLYSVICFESWPGWPLEAHKVQAIVSRSYVISMVLRAHKTKKPYHVKNTNVHQKYGGFHANDEFKRAVQETKGIFLAHNKKPIIAMFDCCCGGIVPGHMHGVDFTSAPYLARQYACTHCSDCKIFNWQAEYHVDDLIQKVKKVAPSITSCYSMHISERDKAGLVKKATIRGKKGRLTLTGKQMYSAFKDIKSFHFDVSRTDDTICFSGTGYGHHLGLCQWGSREMVRKGYDYVSILKFYYPGTTFMRLY